MRAPEFRIGDRVLWGASRQGEIVRLVRKRGIDKAVVFDGWTAREIPLTNLRKADT